MPRLHIVIPFYNEATTLRDCIERISAAELPEGWSRSIILVDDHSSDGTDAIARDLAHELEARGCETHLTRHQINRGKGAALRTGFDIVLERADDDDIAIIQDADLEYDPVDYARLMQPIIAGEAQAVFGNRFGAHYAPSGLWYRIHAFGNRMLTVVSNLLTGYKLRDMECCYKLFTIPVLRRLRPILTEDRFGVEPQIAAGLARLKVNLIERPVTYDPRKAAAGKKIGWRDALRALWVIIRERFRRLPKEEKVTTEVAR